jgi:hypothetical protein
MSGLFSPSVRLASPALVGHSVNAHGSTPAQRLAALGMASTFGEVIAALPVTYREALKPAFRSLSDCAAKRVSCRATGRKLLTHKANGTWPPQLLGVHQPRFELTKEFAVARPAEKDALKASFDAYRTTALDEAIALKDREYNWLNDNLAQADYLPRFTVEMDAIYQKISADHKVPEFGTDGGITGFKDSPVLRDEYLHLKNDIYAYCSRVIFIEDNKGTADEAKRKAKVALKQAADVQMGDATASNLGITDQVQKAVAAALKKANLGGSVSTLLSSDGFQLTDSSSGKRRWSTAFPDEEEEGQGHKRPCSKEGLNAAREDPRRERDLAAKTSWQEAGRRTRQREAERVVAAARIRYAHPYSYPDELLYLPTPLAIRYLLRAARPAELVAARFRRTVHLGPGVYIPDHLQIHISAGLKYMLPSRLNKDELYQSWSDFVDRLRWRCYWTFKELTGEYKPRPYDPDYEVDHVRNPCEYREDYIENGLNSGRTFIDTYCDRVVPVLEARPSAPSVVKVAELKRFIVDNDYIVTMTDKNLGSSVVTRQWFVDGCLGLLNDRTKYRKITRDERNEIVSKQRTSVLEAAAFAESELRHHQLSVFLRDKVPESEEEDISLPRFYGIPKIHKTPVKMRPIIPCHSAIQNPAAKYVSKALKPLVAQQPYVLRGSKDLAQSLATLEVPRGKKVYLISGDVVAMYPTIPTVRCVDIVQKWWNRTIGKGKPAAEKHFFGRCMRLSSKDLIFDFESETYLQLQGLAMGVASSPDLANLYCAQDENEIVPSLKEKLIFFKRFLDDVLGVVIADSEEEALTTARCIEYTGLELEWTASEWSTPFLDLLVYIDPVTNQIEHKPYRKARNHLERIPWASSHPKDVKKGTFVGEMSRLATLSSQAQYYLEAVQELAYLYIARGYPVDLVNSWVKEYSALRWRNRLGEASESTDVFVLKTSFNPAWSAFNVHELGQTVIESWVGYLQGIDAVHARADETAVGHERTVVPGLVAIPGKLHRGTITLRPAFDIRVLGLPNRQWLVSRKRTVNLADVVAKLKKSVLNATPALGDVGMDDVDVWDA